MQGPVLIADHSEGRDNNFNLIRMLAASGVLVSHAFPLSLGPDTPEPFDALLKGDDLGRVSVFVFFAVSGFYITRSFSQRHSLGTFVLARVLRLFPALCVMLFVTLLVAGLVLTTAAPSVFWPAAVIRFGHQITLNFLDMLGVLDRRSGDLPGLFLENPFPKAFNGALWTLPFEVMCYAGVAVVGLLGLLDRRRLFAIGLVVFMLGYMFRIAMLATGQGLPFVPSTLAYLGLPFVIGMSFWVWRDRIMLSWRILTVLACLTVLAWPTLLFLPTFTLALTYGVFLLGYADTPRLRQYNRLGDYSYGMYIYAFPVQQMMASFGATTPLSNMTAAFPVALFCAILSWHLIEKPALELRHRWPGRRQARSVV